MDLLLKNPVYGMLLSQQLKNDQFSHIFCYNMNVGYFYTRMT